MAQFSLLPSGEVGDLAEDIRELFDELARSLNLEQRAYSGECHPALDVLESDETIEVALDIAGVPAEAVRILYRAGVLLIVGEKAPAPASGEHTFHLVERAFGRFARAVRLTGAFDIQHAVATMRAGELTVVLPKVDERRGRGHRISVRSEPSPA